MPPVVTVSTGEFALTHVFDYRQGSTGVNVDVSYLFVANTSYTIANNLFYGTGVTPGTYSYFDAVLNRTVTVSTSQATTGVVGFGIQTPATSSDVYTRDLYGANLPASFDASTDFTGLFGGPEELQGYFRLFGVAGPRLNWNPNSTDLTYQPNIDASAADYAAQLDAVLATVITNPVEFVTWNTAFGSLNEGTAPATPGFVMTYTPSAGSSLTYGAFLSYIQDSFGRTTLSSQGDVNGTGLGDIFARDETVRLILTAQADMVNASAMSAGTLIMDLGAGNDVAQLFFDGSLALPDLLRVDAGTGNDTLSIGAFFDSEITLGDGNDLLVFEGNVGAGGLGADGLPHRHTVDGGAGDDRIEGSFNHAVLFANGGAGNDVIFGGNRNDSLTGGDGRDSLFGNAGNDTIRGGDGNDTIYGGTGDDDIGAGAGDDYVEVQSGANIIWGGLGNDTVQGGEGGDTIYGGGDGFNQLRGNGGDDVIFAGAGGDNLSGGTGNDILRGGVGADTIYAGGGNDNIGGGAGDDLIFGDGGANVIWGGIGSDTVQGGTGRDTIYGGGDGTNTLLGNGSDDLIFAGEGGDFIGGGAGNDTVRGGAGNDTIYGGLGNDDLAGGAGNDVIFGSTGNNIIWGGVGTDTIHGGTGRDVINGGPGADTFVFASAAHIGIGLGRDVITGFTSGLDRIDLSALNTTFNGTGGVIGGGQASFFYFVAGGLLIGDQNGNGAADWVLELAGAPGVVAGDFIL
jgi:Ca2+-binding RTX toxin-like protein